MSRKPSVLIIASPDMTLGVERASIPALAGYRVHWFSWRKPRTSLLEQTEWLDGLTVPPAVPRGGRVLTPIVRSLSLWARFMALQPCVAHVHYALCGWTEARMLTRLHPLVVSVMGGDINPLEGFHGVQAEATTYLLKHADVVTAKSAYMDARLAEIGVNPGRIERVTWGMDLGRFRPGLDVGDLRARLGIDPDDTVFFCARVSEQRTNKRLVMQAFADCCRTSLTRPILVVSEYVADAEYHAGLRALAGQLGVGDRVRFVGNIPYPEMPRYMNLADAVISVPVSDGMPQTLYQAMSCGTLPVISDIAATQELLDSGFELRVVPVNDRRALTDTLRWILHRRDLVEKMGLRNRHRVAALADKHLQDASMLSIYGRLLAHAGRPQALGAILGGATAQ